MNALEQAEIENDAEEMVRMAHKELQMAEWEFPWWDNNSEPDGRARCVYIGSVMLLTPSGKYYMPWTTNQTDEDMERDSTFWEHADKIADGLGCWIESGDGSPTDVFLAEMED